MNPKPSTTNTSSVYDARINAVLHVYSRAVPTPELESRIADRLGESLFASIQSRRTRRLTSFRRVSMGALAAAAACAIVVASVQHSQVSTLPLAKVQLGNDPGSRGLNGAGGSHVPTSPVQAAPRIDPRSPRTPAHSRATLAGSQGPRETRTAVPRSPYPSGNSASGQPDSSSNPR